MNSGDKNTATHDRAPQAPATTRTATARPRDYRLLVPAGWFRIALTSDRLERSVQALVAQQFRGVDNLPIARRQLLDLLLLEANRARTAGGIELYVATDAVGPVPLAASLVVSLLPAAVSSSSTVLTPEQWRLHLESRGHDAVIVDLPAGKAVRTIRRTQGDPAKQLGSTTTSTNIDVRVPVPHSAAYLLLAFSTPVDPLADAFVELFDAIAYSLRWVAGG